ncbi:hypothetical protein [Synechococcus sp. SynAce01]|uniref:hypothetical protein n=1 Tax=Synechococcus sp. SynAce01 TaxID=1916956 RepID=UPI000AEF62FC|nr:hypothetical protein [Synechococcus sp. SynAce01]
MPQSFFDQLAAAQQRYVSFDQPQHQPNQGAGDTDHDHAADTSDLEDESLDEEQDDEEPLDDIAGDEPEPEPAPRGAQISEALKAERRKTNNLERDLRTLKRQLSQFSKINPDEYERLQEAERQKEQLEREIATRERQLEASAARKVKLVAKERDEALKQVDELRKDRCWSACSLMPRGVPVATTVAASLRSFAPRLALSSGSAKTPMGVTFSSRSTARAARSLAMTAPSLPPSTWSRCALTRCSVFSSVSVAALARTR